MEQKNDAEEFVIEEQDLGDVNDYSAEDLADENKDWKAEALAAKGIAKRRTTALKKAKDALGKAKPEVVVDPKVDPVVPKKGELDYGQRAFLNSLGYKDAEEQKVITDAMVETGKSLDDIVASKFVIGQIEDMRKEKATEDATPGKPGRGGSPARDTKEYWLAKGERELPLNTPENKKLREDIVNARLTKAKSGNVFTSTPVIGG